MNANASVPPASEQLAGHLRSLGSGGLTQLLSERGDAVAEPRPQTLGELAERLLRPGSVRRAAVRLSLPCLQVAETLAALHAPAPRSLLMSMLGVPPTAADGDGQAVAEAVDRLCALGLVWPVGPSENEAEAGGLVMAEALRGLWAHPLDLDRPVTGMDTLVARLHPDALGPVVAALGLTAEDGEAEQRAALLAHHRDGRLVRELVAQAPRDAKDLVEHLSRYNTTAFGSMHHSQGEGWAAERALLVRHGRLEGPGASASWGSDLQLPAEILIALRGPEKAAPFHPRPPQIALVTVTAQEVAEEAAAAAAKFLSQAGTVLHACVQQPPTLLKSGGIGTRELTRLTQASGCPPTVVRLVLECAHAAGLLAREGDQRVLATTAYEEWTAREPARQYAQLVVAWRQMPYTPTLAHDPAQDHPLPVLAPRPACDGCQDARTALLECASALGPQQAVDTTDDASTGFGDLISWHRPRALDCNGKQKTRYAVLDRKNEVSPLAPLLREATLLGILARGTLSPLAPPLLKPPADPAAQEAELAACAQQVLPPLCETAAIGSGPTAEVPGMPSPRLAALLDQMSDREGGHPARAWHFTPSSLRRALDTGRTAEAIIHALHTATGTTELPQALTDLVNDTADAYGGIRLTTPSCVLHGTDTALLTEIAADPRLAPLRLRPLAPAVLTSPAPAAAVLAALQEAGYAPFPEQADGTLRIEQATAPRPAFLPAPPPVATPEALDYAHLADALVATHTDSATVPRSSTERLLAADARHLDTAALRRLAHAIDHHEEAAITYTTSEDTTKHTIHTLELDPPYLLAHTGPDDEPRSFHLARLHDADTAPTTPSGQARGRRRSGMDSRSNA